MGRMVRGPAPTRFEKVIAWVHRRQVRFFLATVALTILITIKEWP